MKGFKHIFFDADDTLWENESFFRKAEARFRELFKDFAGEETITHILWQKQEENIPLFGYGSKTYLIGMLDTAFELYGEPLPEDLYYKIKEIITELAFHEVQVYDGVVPVLEKLSGHYRMSVITKGDLTEQQTKFRKSGLESYFHGFYVVPNKTKEDYMSILNELDLKPEEILMVGNSVKSDIAPVIELGGSAAYIPSANIWIHEVMDLPESDRIHQFEDITGLPDFLLS